MYRSVDVTGARTALGQLAASLNPQAVLLGGVALFLLAVATLVENYGPRLVLFSAAALFTVMASAVWLAEFLASLRDATTTQMLRALTDDDPAACFVTGRGGDIGFQNRAAVKMFGLSDGEGVITALQATFADPARKMSELLAQAESYGSAKETITCLLYTSDAADE